MSTSGLNTRKKLHSTIDRQRAEFLRSCRRRVEPEELGLPQGTRKRGEGLRREDVAAHSGVSVTWYTWLEQGRAIRVSDEVLERLCRTLRLSQDERFYLFSLVQQRPPRIAGGAHSGEAPEVARMIHGLSIPAVAMNLRWDVFAWNRMNSLIFRDYANIPPARRNLMEILFTQPSYYQDPIEYEDMARRLLAQLRVDYSRSGEDPRFESLIRRLDTTSPVFHKIWRTPEINVRSYGLHRFTHARYGPLAFESTSYVPDGFPSVRVIICTPIDQATGQIVATLRTMALT